MKTVWRVQNREGQGPYNYDFPEMDMEKRLQLINTKYDIIYDLLPKYRKTHPEVEHPGPSSDPKIQRNMVEGFEFSGFQSKEQALQWFPQEILDKLEGIGFFLVKIKAKKITAIGKYQILFKKS